MSEAEYQLDATSSREEQVAAITQLLTEDGLTQFANKCTAELTAYLETIFTSGQIAEVHGELGRLLVASN